MKAVKAKPQKRLIQEAVEWIVVTALHHIKFTEKARVLARANRVETELDQLEDAGCNKETLLDMFTIARELPEVSPKFTARKVEALAGKIEGVIAGMKELTPFTVLPMADDDYIDTSFPLGRLHVWQELEKGLLRWKQVCDTLADLCQSRVILIKNTLERFGYLVPVVYVDSKTRKYSIQTRKYSKGKPHYAQVSQLLDSLVNIKRNENQLEKDHEWAKREYPHVVWWMRRHLDLVIEDFRYR